VFSAKPFAALSLIALLHLAPTAQAATNFSVINNGLTSYRIGGVDNPTLSLTRGVTYTFTIAATGHPFWIKTVASVGTANAYNTGVTNNGIDNGTLTFVVPLTAPATLHYCCEFHASMTGTINVSDPVPVQPDTWGRLKSRYVR
jgi:hypothetical protein